MYKVKIEQGYNTVEFEVPVPNLATLIVESIKPFVTKETTFTITCEAGEKESEDESLSN